jgi:hypothetical protein
MTLEKLIKWLTIIHQLNLLNYWDSLRPASRIDDKNGSKNALLKEEQFSFPT